MTKKICVIGHFGFGLNLLNGQTIKTKIITDELINLYGKENVLTIDTHGGIRNIFKAPFQVFRALKNAKNVIILPAHNGLKAYIPLLSLFKGFFEERKIHYIVIGGWLPEFVKQREWLKRFLEKIDFIYVETRMMKQLLVEENLKSIFVMPNCKPLKILSVDELVFNDKIPYKLCTFSRVMKEKGIEDAVEVVKEINEKYGAVVYTLDIYGQVDVNQKEWFSSIQSGFPKYINYAGLVPYDKSVDVLKDYFALLFPTHFYTEGIPGTIIDAYAAGIPVIAARWENFADIIEDGITGKGYKLSNNKNMIEILEWALANSNKLNNMKKNCIVRGKDYLPKNVIKNIIID